MKKILCLLLSLLLTGCAGTPAETKPVELKGALTLHCLEGAVLVQCNGENLLVDCGIMPQTLEEYGVETLSAIVLTDCEEARREHLEAILEQYPADVWSSEALPAKDQWLDCAHMTLLGQEDALALKIEFGEDSFLLAGSMNREAQTALAERWGESLRSDVLHVHVAPAEADVLRKAAEPEYLMVDGKADRANFQGMEVFDTEGFGAVRMQTEGNGIQTAWSLHTSHDVAS